MGRDMAKKAATDWKSQQKIYKTLLMKIRKDSGIFEALYKNQEITGVAPTTYAQAALVAALRKDGYLPEESQETEK